MIEYNDRELELYSEYMEYIFSEIRNESKLHGVWKEDIDIKDIKDEGDTWTFIVKIKWKKNRGDEWLKNIIKIKKVGYTTWLNKKISDNRDKKLKELLGI